MNSLAFIADRDPLDLLQHVRGLVEAGQHDGDVGLVGVVRALRGASGARQVGRVRRVHGGCCVGVTGTCTVGAGADLELLGRRRRRGRAGWEVGIISVSGSVDGDCRTGAGVLAHLGAEPTRRSPPARPGAPRRHLAPRHTAPPGSVPLPCASLKRHRRHGGASASNRPCPSTHPGRRHGRNRPAHPRAVRIARDVVRGLARCHRHVRPEHPGGRPGPTRAGAGRACPSRTRSAHCSCPRRPSTSTMSRYAVYSWSCRRRLPGVRR